MTKYLKAVEVSFLNSVDDLSIGKIYEQDESIVVDKHNFVGVVNNSLKKQTYLKERFVEATEAEYTAQEASKNAQEPIENAQEPVVSACDDKMLAYMYKEKLEEIKRMCESLKAFNEQSMKRWKELNYVVSYEQMAGEVGAVCDIIEGIVDK